MIAGSPAHRRAHRARRGAAWGRAADARRPRGARRRAADRRRRVGVRGQVGRHAGARRRPGRAGPADEPARNDVTVAFPELAGLAAVHPDVLLDGEVVVLRGGVPSFAALAERFHVRDARRAAALAGVAPATLIAFDVLRLYGVDLTARPWQERREALERLAPSGSAWQLSPVYDDGPRCSRRPGSRAWRASSPSGAPRRTGRARGPPTGSRSPTSASQSCVVGGWRTETDDPSRVGALLLGLWSQGLPTGRRGCCGTRARRGRGSRPPPRPTSWACSRSVATKALARSTRPSPRPDSIGARWLEPRLVVDVRHLGAHRRRPAAPARRPGVPGRPRRGRRPRGVTALGARRRGGREVRPRPVGDCLQAGSRATPLSVSA